MELWLTLLALYGAQCLVRLSRSEVLFVRPIGRWQAFSGPGWKLTQPLDDAAAVVATRLPLSAEGDQLRAHEHPDRLGLGVPLGLQKQGGGLPFNPRSAERIEHRGNLVRVGGQPFHRSATRAGAAALARLLADLAGASPAEVSARLRTELQHALSLTEHDEERTRLEAATRLLAWSTHIYLLLFLVGLPAAMGFYGEEAGLLRSFPVLALAHVASLAIMLRAHRRLFPADGGQRFEDVLAAALYPPALLRARARMQIEILGRFHPAVHAAARLEGEERRTFLRAEVARLELALQRGDATLIAPLEHEALNHLLSTCGESREALFAAMPAPGKPGEGSYCPICSAEYLMASGTCVDCGATLVPY